MIYTKFEEIPLMRYGLIMADPPWQFVTRSAKGLAKSPQAHYPCMTLAEIRALPVAHLADRNCLLWLWATNPLLPDCIATLGAWGFRFATAGHWSKRTANGKLTFGGGYWLRSAGEPFLIGTIGRPERKSRSVRGMIDDLRRAHSQKPELAFQAAEELLGDVPRIELFSRTERPGWDSFGNEVGSIAA